MPLIVFTGGGTAGHVTPNIALFDTFRAKGWDIAYIGSHDGIERELIESEGVKYHPIAVGKLRRYFDLKNLTDPFKVLLGLGKSIGLLRKLRPNVVFSKGGFVSVPVVIAAWLNGIPIILHESDITPGLANKISAPFANKICTTFPETLDYLPKNKAHYYGTPIRSRLLAGDSNAGLKLCGFTAKMPVLMVMGGSQGAKVINQSVREALPSLLSKYQVVHLCGKGNIDKSLLSKQGYKQFDYVKEELPDIFAAADMVVSRAGANSLYEILSLQIPNLLIPLSKKASRGDQILNARSFYKQGFSMLLLEEHLTQQTLLDSVNELYQSKEKFIQNMKNQSAGTNINKIVGLIEDVAK